MASVGLAVRRSDLADMFLHPGLLVRGLITVNLAVPLVALAMLAVLPIEPIVKAGIFTMAVSPLAVYAPDKMLKVGANTSDVISLYAALILAAFVVVPATFGAVALLIPHAPTIAFVTLVQPLAVLAGIPLLIGLAIGSLAPAVAERLASAANMLGTAGVLVAVVVVVIHSADRFPGLVGDGTLIAMVVTILVGMLAGHVLGGRDAAHRSVLAVAAINRHPGIAVTIVDLNYRDGRAELAILLFMLTSMIVAATYQYWFFGRASFAAAGRAP